MADMNALSDAAIAQIKQLFRDFYAEIRQGVMRPTARNQQQRVMAVLDAELAAATDKSNSPATATASVWTKNSSGNLADSGDNITVTNRFEQVAMSSGTLIKCEFILGEWQPYAADCDA